MANNEQQKVGSRRTKKKTKTEKRRTKTEKKGIVRQFQNSEGK